MLGALRKVQRACPVVGVLWLATSAGWCSLQVSAILLRRQPAGACVVVRTGTPAGRTWMHACECFRYFVLYVWPLHSMDTSSNAGTTSFGLVRHGTPHDTLDYTDSTLKPLGHATSKGWGALEITEY